MMKTTAFLALLLSGCAAVDLDEGGEVDLALDEVDSPSRLGDVWRTPMGSADSGVCQNIGGAWSSSSGGRCWTRPVGLCYMAGILPSSCHQFGGVYGSATRCWWPADRAPNNTTCPGIDATSAGWYDPSPTCMAGDVAASACGLVNGSYTYDPTCPPSESMRCDYSSGRLAKKYANMYTENGNCTSGSVQGKFSGATLVCWTRDYRAAFATMEFSEANACGALGGSWHSPTQHCWFATP